MNDRMRECIEQAATEQIGKEAVDAIDTMTAISPETYIRGAFGADVFWRALELATEEPDALAPAVKQLRRDKLLTQAALAKLSGLGLRTIGQIERGASCSQASERKLRQLMDDFA